MSEKAFKPCRVQIDLELLAADSCEDRLAVARQLLHLVDETFRYMSRLYEGDGGELDLAGAIGRFKVRSKSETTAVVQVRVVYIDGYPDRDSTHVVGIVTDKDHLRRSRDKAIGWWRANLERFDNVERVEVVVYAADERGNVGACDLAVEQLIWKNGREA